MKIILTKFAKARHFDASAAGTVITDYTPDEFESELNSFVANKEHESILPGYKPFCKLLFIRNWTAALAGTMEITPQNEKYLKSGYKARRDGELPVLSRWFEDVKPPRAKFLCIVLYSAAQLKKENTIIDGDYGIVGILGQMENREEPMQPITMLRNELGVKHGGSGAKIDQDGYEKSVEFWQKHATVKVKPDRYVLFDANMDRLKTAHDGELFKQFVAVYSDSILVRWNSQGRTEQWDGSQWKRRMKLRRPADIARVID